MNGLEPTVWFDPDEGGGCQTGAAESALEDCRNGLQEEYVVGILTAYSRSIGRRL